VNEIPIAKMETGIEKFECQFYVPQTTITEAAGCTAQDNSPRELPVNGLEQVRVPKSQLPPPQNYGWARKRDKLLPVLTKLRQLLMQSSNF